MLQRRKHNSGRAKATREKVCPSCKVTFAKSGKLSWAQWEAQTFCSQSCARFKPMSERLIENSVLVGDCLLWTGPKDKDGYGTVAVIEDGHRKTRRAHRLAYQQWVGPVPANKLVMHSCDWPGCINPKHLSLGTPADNTADMIAKGRQNFGGNRGRANAS